jgi:uncharacterized membrane protein
MSERLRAGLALALRISLVLLLVVPWLPRLLAGVPLLGGAGALLDEWFAFHCHRDPARSVALLAVCLRCYGIYFGLGLGALLVRPRLTPFAYRVWVIFAALALVLDVATEALHMRPPFGPLRFATGALLGLPVGVALVLATRTAPSLRRAPPST